MSRALQELHKMRAKEKSEHKKAALPEKKDKKEHNEKREIQRELNVNNKLLRTVRRG